MIDYTTFDTHIHMGQFWEIYESPKELVEYLSSVGVTRYAVSSTTVCEENYAKVIKEHQELKALAGEHVLSVLWLTSQSLHNGGSDIFLKSSIDWKCVKIHPWLSPGGWEENNGDREMAISIARDLQVPLLIHTGETEGSYPSCFEHSFRKHQDVIFILAHGRPVDEVIDLMKKYENVWVDTAFMPTPNIIKCCEAGFVERVLWGSDYPITKYYYPKENMVEYYTKILGDLQKSVSQENYTKITCTNALNLFKIKQ